MPRQVTAEANQCITRVSDAIAVERSRIPKVYVANLTYLGLTHGGSVSQLITSMASLISSDPELSCGIIFLPNTGVMSTGFGPVAVRAAQRGVEAQVCDEGFHLEAREFNVIFAEDGMYSQVRPHAHPGLVVFSDERVEVLQAVGFRSKFAKSALVVQASSRMWLCCSALTLQRFPSPTSRTWALTRSIPSTPSTSSTCLGSRST